MFYSCTALEDIPNLLALNLAPYCYQRMFYNCNSLVSIVGPDVPMAPYCCKEMFGSCSHLTHVILPSKYLAQGCYDSIFANCSCLSSIDIDFEYWWDKTTTNWCTNVAQTGVFTKPITLKNDYSVNRIPFNWSVDLEAPEETPLTFKANGEVIFRLSRQGSPECELKHLFIRFNNNEWMLYEVGKTIILGKDQIIQFRNY